MHVLNVQIFSMYQDIMTNALMAKILHSNILLSSVIEYRMLYLAGVKFYEKHLTMKEFSFHCYIYHVQKHFIAIRKEGCI